jgi:hypothetical protein
VVGSKLGGLEVDCRAAVVVVRSIEPVRSVVVVVVLVVSGSIVGNPF